jgi:hypothetical protein
MIYKIRNNTIIKLLVPIKKLENKFYTRVNNLTNTVFTKEQMDILNLGFQHSFEKPIATNLFKAILS